MISVGVVIKCSIVNDIAGYLTAYVHVIYL